ncbi:bumetanide-sensitive sodium-(potassium)-chloride cotransporter [Anthonomus grandis grandis]|uniref:bumetanide-sensitive sodium-(potassium)-chloride cotransporter n=1 Tax=Anthonomus grandis grandis TaxID=2921223 RepID=UPI0021668C35|nr:bumetanide-sensitive sodium-(potassium)-chloride cotransporter [Anthonomus grandis grandis]
MRLLLTAIIFILKNMDQPTPDKEKKPESIDVENDETLEMDFLRPSSEKRTRFQVNRVRTESYNKYEQLLTNGNTPDIEFHSDNEDDPLNATDKTRLSTENAHKSLRHLTREALPRVDNYRNIMSLQAANRPTLDELHNDTLPKSVQTSANTNGKQSNTQGQLKFGWIQGVLIRCLLNIWGVMLFLRLSWVVGQAGIAEAILLILTTTVVTTVTALSMSAISTNGVIKGGGTYYMISRSLGPEFGGSIGLIFSLANAVACAMYVVGFCESLQDLLLTYGLTMVDGDVHDRRIIGCITIVVITIIVVVGMEWEAKAQLVLLVILVVAIFDYLIGCLVGPGNDGERAKGFVGFNGTVLWQNTFPDYRRSDGVDYEFFKVLAVFFPAATGILAGANISGDLKDPQTSIPKGTILAILITTMSYIIMAIFAGSTVMRDASGNVEDYLLGNLTDCIPNCTYGLQNSFQVIELASLEGSLIYAGCFAATLSSALASLVSAPKVFQALCKDKLYPRIEWFAKGFGPNNEPLRGYVLTFVIAVAFVLIGELNLIAPLISNFFLAAYMLINFSTFHASLAKPVGWRPTFKYYNMWLSLAGSILCVMVMFLISWWTALLTFSVILALYLIVAYRKPDVNWGSTTQAQIYKNALSATQQLNTIEEHVKNYRPQILMLSGMPSARPALVEFAHYLTKNLSMLVCGNINPCPLSQRARDVLTYKANSWLKAHKFKAFYHQVDGMSWLEGARALLKACGIGKLKPNILMMGYKSDWQTCPTEDLLNYFEILHNAFDMHLGLSIFRLQQGLDVSENRNELESKSKSSPIMRRNLSYGQISQISSISEQSFITKLKEDNVNTSPDENYQMKSITESVPDLASEAQTENDGNITFREKFLFQKPQRKKGTIDVWWLYDDGGLTLLLPHILSTRRNWKNYKLRVFALANNREGLELEHRNMASLLAKFRIEYSDLQIVPDISKKASDATNTLFESLVAKFRSQSENLEVNKEDPIAVTDSELMAMKEKTNRQMRLRELLLEHSHEAEMVVVTLPIPRKNIVSAATYMAWLELLTKDMPPVLLVRGNQTSVLTFYS